MLFLFAVSLVQLQLMAAAAVTEQRTLYTAPSRHRCQSVQNKHVTFSLVRRSQRSELQVIHLQNAVSWQECASSARSVRGLAFNYGHTRNESDIRLSRASVTSFTDDLLYFNYTRGSSRKHFWQQPEEFFNCHVLQCPENGTFGSMVTDSRFDYYSLYAQSIESKNYTCLPELGIFEVHTNAEAFLNASRSCTKSSNSHGALAHVASMRRTAGLSKLLRSQKEPRVHLAYVGLLYNKSRALTMGIEFFNRELESLNCFIYRAWSPGYPKTSDDLTNCSCVALTDRDSWINVACDTKLPFICEVYTS